MTRLIKLTGVAHPDMNGGRPQPVYIDSTRVLSIAPAFVALHKEGAYERQRQAIESLHEEVSRVVSELNAQEPNFHPDNEAEAAQTQTWMRAKDAAASLSAAANMCTKYANQTETHPRVPCTEVCLACGTGLEHGVMLMRVMVSETPEQVADAVTGPWTTSENKPA